MRTHSDASRPAELRLRLGLGLLLVAAALSACAPRPADDLSIPTSPTTTVPMGTDVTLAPGESMTVNQESLTLTFVEISGDSRCPTNATIQCVWGGSAVVAVRATDAGGSRAITLESIAPKDMVAVGGLDVRLVAVTPVPTTTDPIPPAAYRITLRVTRR